MALLSYLYPRIRGSQEDVATMSLVHILGQSEALRRKFARMMADALGLPAVDRNVFWQTQQSGKNRERPDITGTDETGKELFICEAKFYAGLTANQPGAYLDRIRENGGLGLVFLCPERRTESLWKHLCELCPEAERMDGGRNHLMMVSGVPMGMLDWMGVVNVLRATAEVQAMQTVGDIEQLADFCRVIDSEEYPPFEPEDFGKDVARKIERYQVVIDLIVDKMLADPAREASTSGLRATPYKYGYCRYIHYEGFEATLWFSRSYWANPALADTPFWLCVQKGWQCNAEMVRKAFPPDGYRRAVDDNGSIIFGLEPKPFLTMDETAEDLLRQINRYVDGIKAVE